MIKYFTDATVSDKIGMQQMHMKFLAKSHKTTIRLHRCLYTHKVILGNGAKFFLTAVSMIISPRIKYVLNPWF